MGGSNRKLADKAAATDALALVLFALFRDDSFPRIYEPTAAIGALAPALFAPVRNGSLAPAQSSQVELWAGGWSGAGNVRAVWDTFVQDCLKDAGRSGTKRLVNWAVRRFSGLRAGPGRYVAARGNT